MPVILVPREVEIRRMMVQDQPGQNICNTPSQPIRTGHVPVIPATQVAQIGGPAWA
jgi:hypothetical protein